MTKLENLVNFTYAKYIDYLKKAVQPATQILLFEYDPYILETECYLITLNNKSNKNFVNKPEIIGCQRTYMSVYLFRQLVYFNYYHFAYYTTSLIEF